MGIVLDQPGAYSAYNPDRLPCSQPRPPLTLRLTRPDQEIGIEVDQPVVLDVDSTSFVKRSKSDAKEGRLPYRLGPESSSRSRVYQTSHRESMVEVSGTLMPSMTAKFRQYWGHLYDSSLSGLRSACGAGIGVQWTLHRRASSRPCPRLWESTIQEAGGAGPAFGMRGGRWNNVRPQHPPQAGSTKGLYARPCLEI